MQFFKSKNVKIFPCFSRGTYACNSEASTNEQIATIDNVEDNLSSTRIFDPEARLITEASLTSLYGNVLGHKNYIVEIDAENNITKVVIQGYYFEITDFKFASGDKLAIKPRSIEFTNHETNLIDPNRITYRLSSLAPKSDVLDYLESSDNTYYCTAIGQVTSDEELTDDMSILSFDDKVLRLDAKDDAALAIFTAGHVKTIKETKDSIDSLGIFKDDERKSQFEWVKDSIAGITAESLYLDAFVDKSPESIKESFTGEVKEDSDGFALGNDVYKAIQQLKDLIGNLDHVMNFRGAYAKFDAVESPKAGDVITFSEDCIDDTNGYKASVGSEWVYTRDDTWVEIGTASASDAAIANNKQALESQAKDISAINTAVANKLELSDFNKHLDGHAKSQAELEEDFEEDLEEAYNTIVGLETDTKDTLTIYGAKKYAKEYADSLASNYDEKGAADSVASDLTGAETDSEAKLTLYGLQKAINVLKGDGNLGEAPNSLQAEAAARSGEDIKLQNQITNLSDLLQTHQDKTAEHTNTAHSHVNGIGTITSGGGIAGNAKIDLNLEFAELGEDKKLKLVDKTSKDVVAEFEASEFIKDGMLNDVSYDAAANKLTFTWNTDAGAKTNEVELTDILDPYVFEAGAKLDVASDGTKVTYSHETVAAPTETTGTGRKYLTSVTTDDYGHITGFTTATEVDQDLTVYKVHQDPVADPTANGNSMEFIASISQDEQGVITATKKAVDLDNYYTKEEVYKKEDVYNKDAVDNISYSLSKGMNTAKLLFTHKNIEGVESTTSIDLEDSIENIFQKLLANLRFYEVNFDGNGDDVGGYMSSRIVAGPEYSLPKGTDVKYTPPCQTHQRFKGWSLSSSGSEIIESYTFVDDDENKTTRPTFYAIWETIPSSLTKYDKKDAACETPGNLDYYWCTGCQTAFEDSNATQKLDNYTIEPLGHTWVAATCTAPKTCSVCTATEGEPAGHDWADADCDTPKTCNTCGATEGEALGHTAAEAVEENKKDATCGQDGSYDLVVYCSVCNAEISRETKTIPATGEHVWNEGEETKAPEVGVAGEKTYTCEVCGNLKTEDIPALEPAPEPEA